MGIDIANCDGLRALSAPLQLLHLLNQVATSAVPEILDGLKLRSIVSHGLRSLPVSLSRHNLLHLVYLDWNPAGFHAVVIFSLTGPATVGRFIAIIDVGVLAL